jgi:hypothetical protein
LTGRDYLLIETDRIKRVLASSTSRDSAPGTHTTGVYVQDISSLQIGPQ